MFSQEFHFLLPQTTLRSWGIPEFRPTKLLQYEYIKRREYDDDVLPHIYDLNELILELSVPNKKVEFHRADQNSLMKSRNLVDCHILNLEKYYKIEFSDEKLTVIDYSTLGHRSLLFSDIRYPVEFIRGCRRNTSFYLRFKPKEIFHWDDYAKNLLHKGPYFGWKNRFLSTKQIQRNSRIFLEKYKSFFPELRELNLLEDTTLILAHNYDGADSVEKQMNDFFEKDPMLAEKFIKSRNILLKQHRTSLVKYPTEFTLMGKNVRVLQSPQSRLLPAEILILGLAKLDLYSAGSSAIFSNHFKQYNLFTTHATKDTKDYGLMYKRLGINLDSNLKDAPDAAM